MEPLCIERWGLLLDITSTLPLLLDTLELYNNIKEDRVEGLHIGRWVLLLVLKGIMPLSMDTLNKPTL